MQTVPSNAERTDLEILRTSRTWEIRPKSSRADELVKYLRRRHRDRPVNVAIANEVAARARSSGMRIRYHGILGEIVEI